MSGVHPPISRTPEPPYIAVIFTNWADHDATAAWKQVAEHLVAQERGRSTWYADYTVRVATVERDYRKPGV